MESQSVNLHRIWLETSGRLDVLSKRVQEGRDVMAASEFARWLFFSGILKLLEANSQDGPLKIDGAFLRWKCEELIQQCNDRFRKNSAEPSFTEATFQSIHEKLDKIAGHVSGLSVGRLETGDSHEVRVLRDRESVGFGDGNRRGRMRIHEGKVLAVAK